MTADTKPYVPCRIARGGFTNEKQFTIPVTDDGSHQVIVGICHWSYLLDAEGKPLTSEQPPPDTTIDGFVQCRKLRRGKDMFVVEVPSMDLFTIKPECLREF